MSDNEEKQCSCTIARIQIIKINTSTFSSSEYFTARGTVATPMLKVYCRHWFHSDVVSFWLRQTNENTDIVLFKLVRSFSIFVIYCWFLEHVNRWCFVFFERFDELWLPLFLRTCGRQILHWINSVRIWHHFI